MKRYDALRVKCETCDSWKPGETQVEDGWCSLKLAATRSYALCSDWRPDDALRAAEEDADAHVD